MSPSLDPPKKSIIEIDYDHLCYQTLLLLLGLTCPFAIHRPSQGHSGAPHIKRLALKAPSKKCI